MTHERSIRLAVVMILALLHCVSEVSATEPSKGEPTNAAEAAAKKPQADEGLEARYQAFVATLPADQQAWEKTLQENLGNFYLPIHKRQRVEGRSNCWDFVQDDPSLPRVLLIGDSVSGGYTLATRKLLAGKANVHKAPENCGPTANGVKKLDIWLGDGRWDVIHFNFGLHDSRTPAADYEARLRAIVARLKNTGAKLIWASTTPRPADGKDARGRRGGTQRGRSPGDARKRHRHRRPVCDRASRSGRDAESEGCAFQSKRLCVPRRGGRQGDRLSIAIHQCSAKPFQ